jgi:hypothetical protein
MVFYKHRTTGNVVTFYSNSKYGRTVSGETVPLWAITESTEWYIVDINWRIISLKDMSTSNIHYVGINGEVSGISISLDNIILTGRYSIFEVERLSDTKRFIVDDIINTEEMRPKTAYRIISFNIVSGRIVLSLLGPNDTRFNKAYPTVLLENATLYSEKKFYLSTLDRVNVMEGDKFYSCRRNGTLLHVPQPCQATKGFNTENWSYYFASHTNACKYIEDNTPKPLFVTQDRIELWNREDVVYSVCPKDIWATIELTAGNLSPALRPTSSNYAKWIHFSSKLARDEYIKFNKPNISLAELQSIGLSKVALKKINDYLNTRT